MFNKKSTKRALLMSALSLLLCFSMLVGTTFAWFTDTVTSGNNKIVAGNLDIELEHAIFNEDGTLKEWKSVSGASDLFEETLWEPGHTQVVYLRLSNLGTLALKYELAINIVSETPGENVAGADLYLSDYIHMGVVEKQEPSFKDRDAAVAAVGNAGLISDGYVADGTMTAGADPLYMAVVVYMPETVDNDANYRGDAIPTINLGINLVATQLQAENDSFGNDYDEGAKYVISSDEEMIFNGNKFDTTVVNNGTVDITGGSINASQVGLENSGNATLNNVEINANGGNALYNEGTAELKDVTLNMTGSTGYIANSRTDGSVTVYENVSATSSGGGVNVWQGKAVFKSGTITTNSTSTSARHMFYVADGAELVIEDGEFFFNPTNLTRKGSYICADVNATVIVKGGTFHKPSTRTAPIQEIGGGTVIITGGTFGFDPTQWVAGGYVAEDNGDGTWTVKPSTEDIATILTGDEEHIIVNLTADVDLPITSLGSITAGSGEYKLGGENTKTITINLNGHKLNITTTYWSAIGAKNADATITIKNGTMTSTGNSAGTWNAFDVRLCNCNYVIEDVTFEKAVAIDNAGKTTTIKNVTINETHDYYALWITAEGQNVAIDGLTVNSAGRGIKIDEQYVGTPAKVTLSVSNATFNTVKKGAIMVKSAKGADITLSNVNIENVVDATNAVWVDSDAETYADLVTVTGGTKINESKVITSTAALNSALAAGETDLFLAAGEYDINNGQNKTLTITGLSKKAVITVVGGAQGEANGQLDYGLDSSTVTFNNLTIKTNNATYAGFARLTGTYNDCIFENCYCLNGNSVFTNCTFNVSGDQYNIWTWGAPVATFTGCTFNSDGKAILLYGQANTKLTVDTCTFNDKGGLTDLKAAIEIGNDYNKSYEVIVNNTTVNGYEINDKGISTGTTLWANKNSMGKDKLNVVVDGKEVY